MKCNHISMYDLISSLTSHRFSYLHWWMYFHFMFDLAAIRQRVMVDRAAFEASAGAMMICSALLTILSVPSTWQYKWLFVWWLLTTCPLALHPLFGSYFVVCSLNLFNCHALDIRAECGSNQVMLTVIFSSVLFCGSLVCGYSMRW